MRKTDWKDGDFIRSQDFRDIAEFAEDIRRYKKLFRIAAIGTTVGLGSLLAVLALARAFHH